MNKFYSILFLFLTLNAFSQTIDCSSVVKTNIDKITGEQKKMTSPYPFKGSYALVESPVTYVQTIKDGDTILYMSLQTIGTTLNLGENGVIILLANGSKIERPNEKIDCTSNSYGWRYSAFISLNKEDIELLKNNEIEIFRLYIYDGGFLIPNPDTKVSKAYIKYITMMRTYLTESLSCILN